MWTFFEDTINTLHLLITIFWQWPYILLKKFVLPKRRKEISKDIVLITGSGSGIGRLMAIKLAEKGATIISTDLNESTAKLTADTINANGGEAYSYQLDVTDRKKVYALAEIIRGTIGDVTMLINNAGIVTGKKFMETSDNELERTFCVNAISHCWTLKAFLSAMIAKNSGHVISINSIAGHVGAPSMVDYCASKSAACGLHESIRAELHTQAPDVHATIVHPWVIDTGMFTGFQSHFPLLLPPLEPEYTAERIVDAVLKNEEELYLPWLIVPIVICRYILPKKLILLLNWYAGVHKQMTGFVGRQKQDD